MRLKAATPLSLPDARALVAANAPGAPQPSKMAAHTSPTKGWAMRNGAQEGAGIVDGAAVSAERRQLISRILSLADEYAARYIRRAFVS